MAEQLHLSLPWRYWGVRPCEVCGRKHEQINSPICYSCRYRASKHPCAIPGCHRLIAPHSTTCLWHRPLQVPKPRAIHVHCRECGAQMTPSPIQACPSCRAHTSHLCALAAADIAANTTPRVTFGSMCRGTTTCGRTTADRRLSVPCARSLFGPTLGGSGSVASPVVRPGSP
jgi:hypothetical protein